MLAAHSICNLKYSVPKKIPIVFHNGSKYDYHFIIKERAENVKKQYTCFGQNTDKKQCKIHNLYSSRSYRN